MGKRKRADKERRGKGGYRVEMDVLFFALNCGM
jgi:hypothetical protein